MTRSTAFFHDSVDGDDAVLFSISRPVPAGMSFIPAVFGSLVAFVLPGLGLEMILPPVELLRGSSPRR
jgi:hypothetical protein